MSAELFSKLSGATPRGQDEGGFWGSVGVPLVTYPPFCRGVSVSRLGHQEAVGGAAGEAPDQRSNSRWPNSDDRTRYRRLVLRDRILRHRLRVLPDQDGQLALTTDRSQPVGTLFSVTLVATSGKDHPWRCKISVLSARPVTRCVPNRVRRRKLTAPTCRIYGVGEGRGRCSGGGRSNGNSQSFRSMDQDVILISYL
jgi:hypothetical protein